MREFAERFYKSRDWERCRAGYIKSVRGLCERCLANGIMTPGYIVHHKVHLDPSNIDDPNVTMNWNNLEYLCRKCHGEVHGSAQRRYKVGPNGEILIPPYAEREK